MRICRFPRARLRVLLEDFPLMESARWKSRRTSSSTAQEQMLLLGRKTARERLASFLVARADASAHDDCAHVSRPSASACR